MNISQDPRMRVLLVESDALILRCVARYLWRRFYVYQASEQDEAERLLGRYPVDAVVTNLDHEQPGDGGLEVLQAARRLQPEALRILHSSAGPPDLEGLLNAGLIHHFLLKFGTRTMEQLLELLNRRQDLLDGAVGRDFPLAS